MSLSSARWPITAIWLLVVGTILWLAWASASTAALISIVIIGLAPLAVVFFLARQPEATMAEDIRKAQTGSRA